MPIGLCLFYMLLCMRKKNNILEILAVLVMCISSGSVYFFRLHVAATLLITLLFSVYFYIIYPSPSNRKSFFFVLLYITYISINFILFNNISRVNRVIPYLVFGISSYFILSKLTLEIIAKRLLQVVGVLSFISIIVYVFYYIGIFSAVTMTSSYTDYMVCLYHCVGWAEPFDRLAGIYWEPGAYQIVLNITLFINIAYYSQFRRLFSKKTSFYTLSVISAIILTQSTTGYITFFIILLWAMIKYKYFIIKGNLLVLVFTFSILSVIGTLLYTSDAIQTKIAQSESSGRSSYTVRLADNLGLIQMISERPLFGWSVGSTSFEERAFSLDNETSSNGDLYFMAIFGVPFYLFIIRRCYYHTKYMGWPPMLSVFFFIFFNIAECFLYYPLVFLFLIDFVDSKRSIKYERIIIMLIKLKKERCLCKNTRM